MQPKLVVKNEPNYIAVTDVEVAVNKSGAPSKYCKQNTLNIVAHNHAVCSPVEFFPLPFIKFSRNIAQSALDLWDDNYTV